jgi:photosystem I subunit 11
MITQKIQSVDQELISQFKNDPFVGHLATPFTNSKFIKNYLQSLPAYQENLSPLLKGINIGVSHGYFLLGPFVTLGPLRNSDVALFIGFLSAVSLIIILGFALSLYIFIVSQDEETPLNFKADFLTGKAGKQFISGFIIGGFTGVSIAYILLTFFTKI